MIKKIMMMGMIAVLPFIAYAADNTPQPAPKAATVTTMPIVTGQAHRVLRSGDILNITVWQHKDLTTTVVVDENGNIEYLFLGLIPVANKTVQQLKDVLRKGISENYIVDPKIDITVDRKSLTFFVTGEVLRPGTYEFRPGLTVLEAVALAGGFTDYASRKVKIVRKKEDGSETEFG